MSKIGEKFADMTELPKDVVMDLTRIVLVGNRDLQIENYKGLLEYSEDIIRVAANNRQIVITGTELCINKMEAETIFIGGRIIGIEFCSKNKKFKNTDEKQQNVK